LLRNLALTLPLVALLSAAQARGAEVDKLLPGDTEVLFTMNVRQILDSALVKKYGTEGLKEALKSNEEVQKILESLGFDPFKDLDSITSASPSGADPDKGLAIIHGKFDLAKFKAKGQEAAKEHGDIVKITKAGNHAVFEVSLPNQPKPFFVGLVDGTTIVVSPDKEYVANAFDQAAGKKQVTLKNDFEALVKKVDEKQSLWVVAMGSGLVKGPLAANPQAKMMLGKIETITGGVVVSDEVKADFAINAKNAQDAKDLNEAIDMGIMQAKGILGFLAANNKQLGAVLSMVESMKVKTEGSKVGITAEVSKDAIEKAVGK
jgi:hypothetical protein